MTLPPLKLLVVEDSEADFLLVQRSLRQHGVEAEFLRVDSYAALSEALEVGGWDAILSDHNLPGMDFRATLGLIRNEVPDLPVILVSGSIGEEMAIDLLHRGLSDFVLKDRPARLAGSLRQSLETARILRAQRTAEAALRESESRFSTIFRSSPIGIGMSRLSDGILVEANEALLAIFGNRREEVIGHTSIGLRHFVHPEDRAQIIDQLLQAGRVHNIEFQGRKASGEHLDLLMSAEKVQFGGEAFMLGMITDITPLKVAERSLRASEFRYRTLFESLVEGFAHCRMIYEEGQPTDFEYLSVNPAFVRLTGLKDVVGRRSTQFLPTLRQDNPDLFNLYGDVAQTGIPANLETYLPALGLWVRVSVYRPAAGEFVAVFDDITDRKVAENALRASEARYRTLFESMSEGVGHCRMIFEGDRPVDWEYLAVNSAFTRVIGITNVVGHKVSEVFPGLRKGNPELFDLFGELVITGAPVKFEIFVRALGIWLSVSAYRPAPGEFVAVLDDITHRKEGEEALRASEARFQSVYQSSPVGILLTRLADGVIIDANPAFLERLGLELDEVVGRTTFDLGLWVDPGDREMALQELRATGRVDAMEADLLTASGDCLSVTWSTEVVDLGGERVLVNLVQDVTERKKAQLERERLQAEVAHAQKLESLGALAGGVSHDMNNVLAAIMATGSMMKEMHQDDPVLTRSMDNLLHAAGRGRDLVRGLTDFARKDIPEPKPLDLNEVARREAALLNRATLQKVAVVLDLQEGLPEVMGDASSIANALMNLCVNALDATPAGGRITLRTHAVPDGGASLCVEDTGQGMPPDVLQRAMEPFFTTKPPGKGTGLGLALVYGVMKAHGGTVDIRSEVGRGTRICLSFPEIARGLPFLAEPDTPEAGSTRRLQILLVDDDDLLRKAVHEMLEVIGHEVEGFSDGPGVLQRLAAGPDPDLVILDLSMPGMDGEEALTRLRAVKPQVPVLLATGFQDERSERMLERFPEVDVLQKPFTLMDLKVKLAQIC